MTTVSPAAATEDFPLIQAAVVAELDTFLQGKLAFAQRAKLPTEPVEQLRRFLGGGGKRLRSLLCVLGWRAAGGLGTPPLLVRTAASLEMFHTFALIHDDIMDGSDTRHGKPALHAALAQRHYDGLRGLRAAQSLGAGAATLIGDLALAWSDELWHSVDLSAARHDAAATVIYAMRNELVCGQYLDLLLTGHPTADMDTAMRIARFKTAKYTVERPLHLGAVLAGSTPRMLADLSAYGIPLGEAFQLRDDLLGVFGLQAQTGKPVIDDLRDGKHTALAAYALSRADAAQSERLTALLGAFYLDEAGAEECRTLLTDTGAAAHVERMISDRRRQALTALETSGIDTPTRAALRAIADIATRRQT